MLKAPVNKIIEHTLVDGPGNRMAVFFQGCNISCQYCHNPETQNLCVGCGACVAECPAGALRSEEGKIVWEPDVCVKCDTCIRVCPNHSSPKVTEMTVDEVFGQIRRNAVFIRGITVSGGECSLRLAFVQELFSRCREIGLTCLMDCNGTLPVWNHPVMDVCDGVMLDVKAWDDACFYRLTGAHNETVKENLIHLAGQGKLEELRVVCLEGRVDAENIIHGIADAVEEDVKARTLLKLIRFRNAGVKGELENASSPGADYMSGLKKLAEKSGFKNVKIL